MNRFLLAGVFMVIAIWQALALAGDCRLGADYYERAKAAAHVQQRIEWLQRSLAVCPNYNAWYMLGMLYKAQGQRDQAAEAFSQARTVASSLETEALALGRKGEMLLQAGQLPQALRVLELAHQFHPEPTPAWVEAVLRDTRLQIFRKTMAAADIAAFLDRAPYTSPNGRFTVRPTVNLPVHFDFDRANLNASGKRQVYELGRALARPNMRHASLLLVGHTDKRGTSAYNQILSEKRAATVKLELERQFPSLIGQLQATGRGETELLYDGDDEADHLLNRRVKVTLLH